MPSSLKKLKYADGTEVTAQEAHDTFMKTRVLIVIDETTYEATGMVWYDNNSAQTDPANVGYVKLSYVENNAGSAVFRAIELGDPSLIPTVP